MEVKGIMWGESQTLETSPRIEPPRRRETESRVDGKIERTGESTRGKDQIR